jgi:hypothetical protein
MITETLSVAQSPNLLVGGGEVAAGGQGVAEGLLAEGEGALV